MRTFKLISGAIRGRAMDAIREAPDGYMVTIKEATRTLEQNAALWPILHAFSKQVDYHGMKLSPEDWKNLFTASLSGEVRMVPNLQGNGMVLLGQSTRVMSKSKLSELIEFIYAEGAERGVVFDEE